MKLLLKISIILSFLLLMSCSCSHELSKFSVIDKNELVNDLNNSIVEGFFNGDTLLAQKNKTYFIK